MMAREKDRQQRIEQAGVLRWDAIHTSLGSSRRDRPNVGAAHSIGKLLPIGAGSPGPAMASPAGSEHPIASTWPWIMFQGWRNLLFYSWPVSRTALAGLLPPGLPVDQFQGSGWVSLVPFAMHDLHLRCLPPIPGTSSFPEVNLRTYVRLRNEPGVFFFSIDAASCLGALVARAVFHLPYFRAGIRLDQQGNEFRITSLRRSHVGSPPARLVASWRPRGTLRRPAAGTLEHFLLERYASFAPGPPGELYRGALLHSDWQVQGADAELSSTSLIEAAGLAPPANVVCHFSPGVDTRVYPVQRVPVAG